MPEFTADVTGVLPHTQDVLQKHVAVVDAERWAQKVIANHMQDVLNHIRASQSLAAYKRT